MRHILILLAVLFSVGAFADEYFSVESAKPNLKWVQPDMVNKISVDMVLPMLQGKDATIHNGENICNLIYNTMHDWLEFQRYAKGEVLRIYNTGLYVGLYSTDINNEYCGENIITDFQPRGFDLETIKDYLKLADLKIIEIHRQIVDEAISADAELKAAYDARNNEYKRVRRIFGEETNGQFEEIFLNALSFDEMAVKYDSLSMQRQGEMEALMERRRQSGKNDMDMLATLDSTFKLKLFAHITKNLQIYEPIVENLKEASLRKALLVAEMRMIENRGKREGRVKRETRVIAPR